MMTSHSAMDRDLLLTIGERIAPGIRDLDAAARDRVVAIIEHAIASRPSGVQRQLRLFLSVMRWLPVLRYGRPFERLDAPRQDAVLGWFHDAPLTPLRHGFWGVKTLVFMGYYGRPEIGDAIGYRPARTGHPPFHAR
jgi:hypothetical protein